MKKKFLITGFNLDDFHGSMMHVCEFSKVLLKIDFDVYIAGVEINKKIFNYIKNEIGAKIYFIDKLPFDVVFDYVLVHHDVILPFLMDKGLKYKKIANMSLSGILNLERPGIQNLYGVPLFVNSKRLQEKYKDFYDIDSHVLLNGVSEEFSAETVKTKLKNIAIVSNHAPSELIKASKILRKNKYNVDIYGAGYTKTLITPKILNKYDLIITIGKTVQYALYMGIPVYNYDYFGGNGYITPKNIDAEERYNFSGRENFRKLSAQKLVEEITTQYFDVLSQVEKLKKIAKERYSLEKNIDLMLEIIDEADDIEFSAKPEWKIYSEKCIEYCDKLMIYKNLLINTRYFKNQPVWLYKIANVLSCGRYFKNKLKVVKSIEKHQDMIM